MSEYEDLQARIDSAIADEYGIATPDDAPRSPKEETPEPFLGGDQIASDLASAAIEIRLNIGAKLYNDEDVQRKRDLSERLDLHAIARLRSTEASPEPCPGCVKGDTPVLLDGYGTLESVSGNPGRPGHALGDFWWYCDQYAAPPSTPDGRIITHETRWSRLSVDMASQQLNHDSEEYRRLARYVLKCMEDVERMLPIGHSTGEIDV